MGSNKKRGSTVKKHWCGQSISVEIRVILHDQRGTWNILIGCSFSSVKWERLGQITSEIWLACCNVTWQLLPLRSGAVIALTNRIWWNGSVPVLNLDLKIPCVIFLSLLESCLHQVNKPRLACWRMGYPWPHHPIALANSQPIPETKLLSWPKLTADTWVSLAKTRRPVQLMLQIDDLQNDEPNPFF